MWNVLELGGSAALGSSRRYGVRQHCDRAPCRPSDGGAARWAVVTSLIATAKLNNVEPFAYLRDVLERTSNGYPMGQLDDLLPWNWARLKAAA